MVINLARGETFTAIFHAAVAFAIGALPENMPAVVTTILAYGTQALAKVGAIMKRLQSTETLGSTSAINSDKTGTLTLNEMTAVQMALVGRRYAIEGTGYSTEGRITRVAGQPEVPLDPFLLPMVLASDAVLDDGDADRRPHRGSAGRPGRQGRHRRRRDPAGLSPRRGAPVRRGLQAHGHVPRDDRRVGRARSCAASSRARPTSCWRGPRRCTTPTRGRCRPTASAASGTSPRTPGWAREGLRVLATARKDFDAADLRPRRGPAAAGGDGLELLALVGIVDPPRPTAKASIEKATAAGIRVRMITGDHAVTAGAIARQLGIEGSVMTGAEFAAMDDDAVARARSTRSGSSPGSRPRTRCAWSTCSSGRAASWR